MGADLLAEDFVVYDHGCGVLLPVLMVCQWWLGVVRVSRYAVGEVVLWSASTAALISPKLADVTSRSQEFVSVAVHFYQYLSDRPLANDPCS